MAKLIIAVAVAGLHGTVASSYPTAYPFENEINVPIAPLASTPNWSFDDEDTGGYIYTYAYTYDVPDEPFYSFTSRGCISHILKAKQGAPPLLPQSVWNCTAREKPISSATYYGIVADVKICEVEDCCKEFLGLNAFFSAEPMDQFYDRDAAIFNDGSCDEMYSESLYCAKFDNGALRACYEQYEVYGERLLVGPCFDSLVDWLINNCKLYRVAGYNEDPFFEPESYNSEQTPEESISHTGLQVFPDRMCHPYSYYYPETAKAVDAETIESVCGECGNSCSDGLPANCDDLAKLLENGSDLATLTAKGECAASCSDECVALITDAFGSCKSISSTSSKSSTSGAALNGAIAVAAVAVLLL